MVVYRSGIVFSATGYNGQTEAITGALNASTITAKYSVLLPGLLSGNQQFCQLFGSAVRHAIFALYILVLA